MNHLYPTTMIGSFPHKNPEELCRHLETALDIPIWPQLPRRDFRESIYVQYSSTLPGAVVNLEQEKIYFDTSDRLLDAMEIFYERYLADDLDYFALQPEYAHGFYTMLDILNNTSGDWVKGHVIGPVSFGLTVTDQDLRAILYNDMLADALPKNIALQARWQAKQLKAVRSNVIIFVDEPYMASFGSAYVSLSREQAITMMNEVFAAIQGEGALAGVHCCANTDWAVLLDTSVDILNLDAYEYLENLALYPDALKRFLERGGKIAWGIVPSSPAVLKTTPPALADQLRLGFDNMVKRASARGVELSHTTLTNSSLITPSCGLGTTTIEIADRVITSLVETGIQLRK